MSASPSIPDTPIPGKDPPSPSASPSTQAPTSTPAPSSTNPTPQTSIPIPNPKQVRPSPLRRITTDSLIPSTTIRTPALQAGSQLQTQDLPPHPRPFAPFFTLIHDPSTNTTHHPRQTHYIFSDDDRSEVLSQACVRALAQSADSSGPARGGDGSASEERGKNPSSSGTSSSSSATFRAPKVKNTERDKEGKGKVDKEGKEREEIVLILDVVDREDALHISRADSLSANWQVLNCEIGVAPTWDGAAHEDDGEGEGGLMLRIEGVGVHSGLDIGMGTGTGEGLGLGVGGGGSGSPSASGREIGDEELNRLLEGFDAKMEVLRKVVLAGERTAVNEEEENEEGVGGDGVDDAQGDGDGDGEAEEKMLQEEGKSLVQDEGKTLVDDGQGGSRTG